MMSGTNAQFTRIDPKKGWKRHQTQGILCLEARGERALKIVIFLRLGRGSRGGCLLQWSTQEQESQNNLPCNKK